MCHAFADASWEQDTVGDTAQAARRCEMQCHLAVQEEYTRPKDTPNIAFGSYCLPAGVRWARRKTGPVALVSLVTLPDPDGSGSLTSPPITRARKPIR